MNVFMTTGTLDFLIKIANNYSDEKMLTMVNENGALLLHESKNDTVFNQPRRYEVIESVGELVNKGFVVMNNIPVTEEGRPLFEHQFKNRSGKLETQAGFTALRVLRPSSSNTYVILTIWENETSYQHWKSTDSFKDSHTTNVSVNKTQPKIFESASYISTYTITEIG